MDIRKIIKEEINATMDTFYLIVSEDEKYIYNKSNLGGRSWVLINDLPANAIIRSGYETHIDAQRVLDWVDYYKDDKKIGGEPTSPGKIASNIAKHNPKIIVVDFMIRKREEEFPLTESDLDWIGEPKKNSLHGLKLTTPMSRNTENPMVIIDDGGTEVIVRTHANGDFNYDRRTAQAFIEKGIWQLVNESEEFDWIEKSDPKNSKNLTWGVRSMADRYKHTGSKRRGGQYGIAIDTANEYNKWLENFFRNWVHPKYAVSIEEVNGWVTVYRLGFGSKGLFRNLFDIQLSLKLDNGTLVFISGTNQRKSNVFVGVYDNKDGVADADLLSDDDDLIEYKHFENIRLDLNKIMNWASSQKSIT